MKKFTLTFTFCLFISFCFGQIAQTNLEELRIKKTIVDFLKWYKQEQTKPSRIDTTKPHTSIIVWNKIDNLLKPSINMAAVEDYLDWLKKSGFISDTFINNLRQYHQKIANDLKNVSPTPSSQGIYKIPDLDLDVVFESFEPDEVLKRYKTGIFKRISIVHHKAIVQFYIPQSQSYDETKMIFTLTKENEIWLIDCLGYYE